MIQTKKTYESPAIEVESYSLNQPIASNCGKPVTMGPDATGHPACEEFKPVFPDGEFSTYAEGTSGNSFYADTKNCDCYYTASGIGYFTS